MHGAILGFIIIALVAPVIIVRDMIAHPETLAQSAWHDIQTMTQFANHTSRDVPSLQGRIIACESEISSPACVAIK